MITFDKAVNFKGELEVPSDKSITHRAIIMGALTNGVTLINKPLLSADTLATLHSFELMGIDIMNEWSRFTIRSDGYKKLGEPKNIIDCKNSGTTARLLTGVLAPHKFYSVLTGDPSLSRRPMDRVIKPLTKLGANIISRDDNRYLPMSILPSNKFKSVDIVAETKSAQVKSAVLFAGLQSDGSVSYTEDIHTRDHTERIFKLFGADINHVGNKIIINGGKDLNAQDMSIVGDFSSAVFLIVAGLIFKGSDITIKNVGLNDTRTGFLTVLKSLGVKLDIDITEDGYEKVGNINIKSQEINGGKVSGDIIANIIDEIPALSLLALFATAPIEIRDAKELRIKESDRIKAIADNFISLGAKVLEFDDGLKIYPLKEINKKVVLKCYDDHRIVMINILLAKMFGLQVLLDDVSPIEVSYPQFITDIIELEKRG